MISVVGHHIISPLGSNSIENFEQLKAENSAIKIDSNGTYHPDPTPIATIKQSKSKQNALGVLMVNSIKQALAGLNINTDSLEVQVVLSTTKGNVQELADSLQSENAYLHTLTDFVQTELNLKNKPVLISNACISGGCAIEYAKDVLSLNQAQHVIVCGGDLLSEFVLSGFRSFHAVSDQACKPYDENRTGINLGEAVATLVLSTQIDSSIKLLGAATSNDANHISGPSRTGEGLFVAINAALKNANIEAKQIDYISAHGTATKYNDEMESIAFTRCNLSHAPLNSYKGYFGHTLGAAGVIESILAVMCLENNWLAPSLGYSQKGVNGVINVITKGESAPLQYILKTGSGFGGGNNALVFGKI